MKKLSALVAATALVVVGLLAFSTTASAGTVTINYLQTDKYLVATNNPEGYFVGEPNSGSFGTRAWAAGMELGAVGPYSDAGVVLFFNDVLTLGAIGSIDVTRQAYDTGSSPLATNLWLDTGGNGTFFAFNSSGVLTGLNDDSYFSCATPSLDATSSCYGMGVNGAGGTFTLAQLQAGDVVGIDGNTRVALWIGITADGTNGDQRASLANVSVTTVPDGGATLVLLGMAFTGLGLLRRKIK
jgi:hypothetical protein